MSCGIYKITNTINNKAYIGQSVDIERRWRKHKNFPKQYSQYPLYQAFLEYGINNFIFEIIEQCEMKLLDEREIYYISKYDTLYNGYNQTSGGSGIANAVIKISNEDLLQIIDLLKNSKISQNEISNLFNIGADTVSEINNGRTRRLPDMEYPIRVNHYVSYCEDCGSVLSSHTAKKCVKCHNLAQRHVERPTREELKAMIRSMSFSAIGRLYNISDNGIRGWCRSENLPTKKSDINSYSDQEWEKI